MRKQLNINYSHRKRFIHSWQLHGLILKTYSGYQMFLRLMPSGFLARLLLKSTEKLVGEVAFKFELLSTYGIACMMRRFGVDKIFLFHAHLYQTSRGAMLISFATIEHGSVTQEQSIQQWNRPRQGELVYSGFLRLIPQMKNPESMNLYYQWSNLQIFRSVIIVL